MAFSELLLVPIVGRFSKRCPKALEKFGISILSTVVILSHSIGAFLNAVFLTWFSVKEGEYSQVVYPLSISFCVTLLKLTLTPVITI